MLYTKHKEILARRHSNTDQRTQSLTIAYFQRNGRSSLGIAIDWDSPGERVVFFNGAEDNMSICYIDSVYDCLIGIASIMTALKRSAIC